MNKKIIQLCAVKRVRSYLLCVTVFIVLVVVGCTAESLDNTQRSSIAIYVTQSGSSPTAEPIPTEPKRVQGDSDIIGQYPVLYNALLYTRSHPVSEDERNGYYVPAGRDVSILGVSADRKWLLIRHPAGVDGWIETNRVELADETLRQLMMLSPSVAALVPTPTLSSIRPTAAPVVKYEPEQPEVVVQSAAVVPSTPMPTSIPTSVPVSVPTTEPTSESEMPPPAVITFADGSSGIVEMTAVQDAAIFVHPDPGASPDERTAYFVPVGESVYAVGLAEDRYWVHIVYADGVQGWVASGQFTVTSGGIGMLPTSNYLVNGDDQNEVTAAKSTNLWRLPSRPNQP